MNSHTITLKSGIQIPAIGFGPGIMGYSAKMQKKRSGISFFCMAGLQQALATPHAKAGICR